MAEPNLPKIGKPLFISERTDDAHFLTYVVHFLLPASLDLW